MIHEPAELGERVRTRLRALCEIACSPGTREVLRLWTRERLEHGLAELGRTLPSTIHGALVAEETRLAHPIKDGIASFLEDDVIPFVRSQSIEPGSAKATSKSQVQEFYDEQGWVRTADGRFAEARRLASGELDAHRLYMRLSNAAIGKRFSGGRFFLDAASGPVAIPEHLAYSRHFDFRVCVDFSRTALKEAADNVGDKGIFCLADICRLPFADDSFDGALSAYTVQHVPADQQEVALAELYRVLKPGANLCILTRARKSPSHRIALAILRSLRRGWRRGGSAAVLNDDDSPSGSGHRKPYCRTRDLGWWRRAARSLTPSFSVQSLRILRRKDFEHLFGESERAARSLHSFETRLPLLAARFSRYLVVTLTKP